MPYNPGVTDISGQLRARGMSEGMDSLLKGFDVGLKTYQQNKHMADNAVAKFGAVLANSDSLKTLLTDEKARENAPKDVVKAYLKLQKEGNLGVRDASLLGAFAESYSKTEEDKQQRMMRAAQLQNMQMLMDQQKKQQAEEDQMNARMQQMAQLGRNMETGTAMLPPAPAGPSALMRGPAGPMALGGMDTLGRPGNLNGGGVLRPEVSEQAKEFLQSGAGKLASQGVKLNPAQLVALQQADSTRAGAMERAAMAAESRLAQQGLKNEMGSQIQGLRAEAQAAKDEAKIANATKKDATQAFDETKKLRDEFAAHPNTKSFDVVDNYFERGVKLAQKETSAGDMGLIFALMKVYDPTSTVREGEYATASNSGSIPQQFLNIYNKAKDGQKLQPEQRAQFVETMAEAAQVQHKKLMGTADQYAAIAKKRGLDADEVVAPSYKGWKPPTMDDKKSQMQAAPTGIDAILSKYPPRQGSGPR